MIMQDQQSAAQQCPSQYAVLEIKPAMQEQVSAALAEAAAFTALQTLAAGPSSIPPTTASLPVRNAAGFQQR